MIHYTVNKERGLYYICFRHLFKSFYCGPTTRPVFVQVSWTFKVNMYFQSVEFKTVHVY